ncbi:MAG TPA: hypothetical protein VKQ72_15130 [Aggregatilineales bacterium]|nr:hypothetical protein [Aggregatilineales bacterium]
MPIWNGMIKQTSQPAEAKRQTDKISLAVGPGARDNDEDGAFLASIANLPTAEREEKIHRHEWYKHLASSQEVTEMEWRMEQYQRTGDKRYQVK